MENRIDNKQISRIIHNIVSEKSKQQSVKNSKEKLRKESRKGMKRSNYKQIGMIAEISGIFSGEM